MYKSIESVLMVYNMITGVMKGVARFHVFRAGFVRLGRVV